MSSPVWSELHRIRNTTPRALRVPERDSPRGAFLTDSYLIDMSIIYPGLHKMITEELKIKKESEKEKGKEIFRAVAQRARQLVNCCVGTSVAVDRAVGALMGLVLGDALGAPLEFLAAGNSASTSGVQLQPAKEMMDKIPFVYAEQFNKFRLLRGQWTDDASMAFCLADSLIERSGPGSETGDAYDGADCRCRYLMWWSYGYNNAFKYDHERRTDNAHSVGLGGNIANSLDETSEFCGQMASTAVPPRFTARGEDAGNGSIMRLAPIPIRYHSDVRKAMLYAAEQSYSTHPGGDAAVCCMFMTYFQIRAIHRSEEAPGSVRDFLTEEIIPCFLREMDAISSQQGGPEANGAEASTDSTTVDNQLQAVVRASSGGLGRLTALLRCQPPNAREACWEWNTEDDYCRVIGQTLRARGYSYNGYPVNAGYFGSYCMDGLAMGLWALTHSTSLMDCLVKTANLLGDADTTCAIAGQLAGSFYGYQSLFASSGTSGIDAAGKVVLEKWLRRWDPHSEIELRALLLYSDGAGFIESSTKLQR